jgi:hypothetical protein
MTRGHTWKVEAFFTLALDGGEWSASHPGHFTPGARDPVTHWTGGWVGPRGGLDIMARKKNPNPSQEVNPCHRAHSLVIILTELLWLMELHQQQAVFLFYSSL